MFKRILFLTVLTIASSRHVHFYRKDYTYFEEFDAFYKLHGDIEGISWNSAFMACDDEGAKLFYPKEEGEWKVVKELTKMDANVGNITDIIVGIHDETGQGEFITVDGQSTPTPLSEDQIFTEGQDCILMDIETGAYKTDSCVTEQPIRRPFVCKKIDEKPCPTIDLGYEYAKLAKKCYKVNTRTRTYQEAWHTCFMEGGLLASPENSAEAKIIYDMMSSDIDTYFVGFRRIFPGSDFYNVKGQKLEEGYQLWYDRRNEDSKNCGVVYRYNNLLYTKSKDCQSQLHFICEMQAKF